MDPVAIVLTTGGALGAITTIVATSGKWGRWLSVKAGRVAVNHIRERDIDPKSFVGKGFEFNKEILELIPEVRSTHIEVLKVELLQLISNTPEKVEVIEDVFSKYKALGGNSYMCQVVQEWREMYGREAVKKQIAKKSSNIS